MQIASFILIHDRALRQLEKQLEAALKSVSSPNIVFLNLVPAQLQELGVEHPISIPFNSFYPLDQVAERQHEHIFTTFEDPERPSKLGQLAKGLNVPIFYISPGRVRAFVRELEELRLSEKVRPEDVESLLKKRVAEGELPAVIGLLEQFRHDLYRVYRDASDEGMGIVVLLVNQPEEMTSEEGFPRAA